MYARVDITMLARGKSYKRLQAEDMTSIKITLLQHSTRTSCLMGTNLLERRQRVRSFLVWECGKGANWKRVTRVFKSLLTSRLGREGYGDGI